MSGKPGVSPALESLVVSWKCRAADLADMEKVGGAPILSSRRRMLEDCVADLMEALGVVGTEKEQAELENEVAL